MHVNLLAIIVNLLFWGGLIYVMTEIWLLIRKRLRK